ncbi:uncharacterized protein EAF01_009194 [Botrytis porri]|uniref:Uncharacterized protein n=1 Tax=Botrytis porri TaxID=87229 RepID=A0A4Z1KFV7_9HELO|nr:uncharacterized protein EAF01_009194 [Botrytis porri]KAF7896791.1 hypothetical protein EAF01_009194 [Botrytis porri]TGO84266.1 hypothetical protein BPOR_0526g00060 [Botrytis porri]
MVFDNAIFAGTCAQDCRGGAVVTLFGPSRGVPSQGLISDGKIPSWIPNGYYLTLPDRSNTIYPSKSLHDNEDFENFENLKPRFIVVSYINLSVGQGA